jgi:hypothetical protein
MARSACRRSLPDGQFRSVVATVEANFSTFAAKGPVMLLVLTAADRFAANARRLLNAPQRPAQSPQRYNLMSLVVPQDGCSCGVGTSCSSPASTSRVATGIGRLHVVPINDPLWVSTEGRSTHLAIAPGARRFRFGGRRGGCRPEDHRPRHVGVLHHHRDKRFRPCRYRGVCRSRCR